MTYNIDKIQKIYNNFLEFLGIDTTDKKYPVYILSYDAQCTYVLYEANKAPIFTKPQHIQNNNLFAILLEDHDEDIVTLFVTYFDNSSVFNKSLTEQFAKEASKSYPGFLKFPKFSHIIDFTVHDLIKSYYLPNDDYGYFPNIDLIINLSKTKYEKRECIGQIIFTDSCYKMVIVFPNPIELSFCNLKEIRKLMELTSNKLSLIVKKNIILGLGYSSNYCYKIVFKGLSKWELFDRVEMIFQYDDAFMKLNSTPFHYEDKIQNYFNICANNAKALNELINWYADCKYGTILIITEDAQKEAIRLSKLNKAILIKPVKLCKNNISKNLANIDGALIVDHNGICYAIGAILDGIALVEGSMSRGARYNSTINYLANKSNAKYMAAIISEDGYVNIFDTLDCKPKQLFE